MEFDINALQLLEEKDTAESGAWPPPTAGVCCSTF
ncbi:ALQxL family class IV lanthipeptide [Streptomyces sp. NPDC002920]